MIIESVFNGRDNTVDLLLTADGAAVNLAAVTRMQLSVGEAMLDSSTHPQYFNWTPDPPEAGKLILKLGAAGLSAGEGQTATLFVFDPSNPSGIRWGQLKLNVY
jgi:hypothetical protein